MKGKGQLRGTDTPEVRKARGAFFTPPQICRYLVEWAIRSPSDTVFEPSCGEAAFLEAAADRFEQYGATRQANLHGIDVDGPSVNRARARLAERNFPSNLATADFFEFATDSRFDAIIGNPPYVRYQG